jgi:hypothetical protein
LKTARKPEKYLSQIDDIKANAEKYASFFSIAIPVDLLAVLNIGNKAEFEAYTAKKAEYELAKKKAEEKELKARHKKELKKWLDGETHRLYLRDGFDYLRLSDGRIETSQAVNIPLEIGKRIYEKVKDNSLKVDDNVLNYTVNEVGKLVKIGCHTFKSDYLLNFGKKVFQ